jgi:DNA mismatch repair protein MutS2
MEEQRKADLAALRLRQKELELRERGVTDLRRLLSESRKTLENLVKDIREGELTGEKTRAVKDFLAGLALEVGDEEARLERDKAAPTPPAADFGEDADLPLAAATDKPRRAPAPLVLAEGAQVLIGQKRKRGLVIRKAKKGYWVVETESVRLTIPEADLVPVADSPTVKPSVQVELAPRGDGESSRASFELDLRGFRLTAALEAVEKQVDAAALQGLALFQILHGTGEGVLGKGIHDYLRNNPAVADFHFARPEEGGYGKTIVRLK